jgi:predicted molibdopterin-dependent oxidoreductase YjgC
LVNVGPPPGERTDPHQLCIRGKFLLPDIIHHPDRVTTPLIRRKGQWIETGWDEAIGYIASKLTKHRGNGFGMLTSSQDTMEDNYALQKFTTTVMKSENTDLVTGSADPDMRASLSSLLSGSNGMRDLHKADTLFLLGTDASVTHPMLENRIRKAFKNGTRVLYVNEMPTRTSLFSTEEIHFKKGKENLLLYVLMALLVRNTTRERPIGFAEHASEKLLVKAMKSCTVKKETLENFVRSLAGSKNLCIIAGGSFTQAGTLSETLKALGNILYLKGDRSKCNIIIPDHAGYEDSGSPAGIHPAGHVRKKGLTCYEMLSGTGRGGISALVVAGDLPPVKSLKRVKFLVQMNMFKTELTEFADVFLPVTGLLENEGHFHALDGKIKRVRRAVPGPGQARTIPAIISALAGEMSQSGFTEKPETLWKEIQARSGKPAGKPKKMLLKFQPLNPAVGSVNDKTKRVIGNEFSTFMYRGNRLTELIPDLELIEKKTRHNKT